MNQPIVFVHGLATSAQRTWGETGWLDIVSDSNRPVHAPDLLGHGTADCPLEPAAYDQTEAVFYDGLPEGPLDGVGFSLGSRTLLATELAHPGTFSKLVLSGVGENLFRRDGSGARLAEALASSEGGESEPLVSYFSNMAAASGQSPEVLQAILQRPHPPVITPELLSGITAETLIVIGENDFAGPGEPLAEAIPNAKLVTLRGVDHFATPKAMGFIDAGLDFLDLF